MHKGLLHRYNTDYKQRFQPLVIPVSHAKIILKLAHDELGHSGTARTYALVKRMFYWKGLKKDTENYVKNLSDLSTIQHPISQVYSWSF